LFSFFNKKSKLAGSCSGSDQWEYNPGVANITTAGDQIFRHVLEYETPTGKTGQITNTVLMTIK